MTMTYPSKADDMKSDLVSIIIPAYNAERWIERCVSSALRQTYGNIEVIVVENGSTDRTMDVVQAIEDRRLRVYTSEKGVSNARNKGIDEARGRYLTFLDADDWFSDDAIEKMISAVDADVDIVSARYYADKPFEQYKSRRYERGSVEYILKCLYTPTKRGNVTGNLYRTEYIKEKGIRFNPHLSHAEDSAFFVGLLMKDPVVIDLEEPVYHVFLNPDSVTRKNTDIEGFCDAIGTVCRLLEGREDSIINAGYIFALNQLLVILVNTQASIKLIASTCQRETFAQAIARSDIELVPLGRKVVFQLMKWKRYGLIFLVISIRQLRNRIVRCKSKLH